MRIIPVTFAIATCVSHGDRGLDRLWRGIFSPPHCNCICTFSAASVEKQTTLLLTLASNKFLHIWVPSSANVIKSSNQTCDVLWAQYRYGNNVRIWNDRWSWREVTSTFWARTSCNCTSNGFNGLTTDDHGAFGTCRQWIPLPRSCKTWVRCLSHKEFEMLQLTE